MAVDRHIEDEDDRVEVGVEIEGQKGEIDFDTLKTGGIIKQRQRDLFTVRLKCPGGRMPLERLKKALEVARRYGGDYVHLSFRQSVEIPYVDYRDLGQIEAELAEVGQEIASCGPRVRVPTACSGCEYNPNGLTETQKMARQVCDDYFGTGDLVHKFKTSFSGCPIDCARTVEMDLGFQGAVEPTWDQETCVGCGICARACTEGAIDEDAETGEPHYHAEKCLCCADCIRACPTGSWQAEQTGWMVRVGGRHGRHPIHGARIAEFLPDEKVMPCIETVLGWYEQNGRGKGRKRIGQLLMQPGLWDQFLTEVQPVLGPYAVEDPSPPHPNEIHFET